MDSKETMQLDVELENYLLDVQNLFVKIYCSAGHSSAQEQDVPRLSLPQIRALLAFHEERAYSMSRLSDNAKVKIPSMSAMIERLRSQGLVDRIYDVKDRRIVLVSLTDRGLRLRQALIEGRKNALYGLLSDLAPNEQTDLAAGLQKIAALIKSINGDKYTDTAPSGRGKFVMRAA